MSVNLTWARTTAAALHEHFGSAWTVDEETGSVRGPAGIEVYQGDGYVGYSLTLPDTEDGVDACNPDAVKVVTEAVARLCRIEQACRAAIDAVEKKRA